MLAFYGWQPAASFTSPQPLPTLALCPSCSGSGGPAVAVSSRPVALLRRRLGVLSCAAPCFLQKFEWALVDSNFELLRTPTAFPPFCVAAGLLPLTVQAG